MTQKEIDQLKKGTEAILMDTMQFVNVGHVDLPTAINIVWRHDPHELVLTKVTDKEFLEINKPVDLKKQDILILNYNHPGHERVYICFNLYCSANRLFHFDSVAKDVCL